ncbi:arylsulfatase A-like enzyme [Mesorhizobium jarvisii]
MKRTKLVTLTTFAALALIWSAAAKDVLPQPQQAFQGKIGRTAKDSVPDFPKGVEAPKGAPNVLLILTDDVGFGASSTFGGPIPTPSFDRLAAEGLRYNDFNTTALCSPSRAALITGRNHHSCATGIVMEMATGYPGYNSLMPKSCATIARVLEGNGYSTAWFGKNHNVPDWQTSQAGPFDLWPTGLGFQYFYGFLGGDTDQWHPALFENTRPVLEPEHGDHNYILDHDLADHTINWMREQKAVAPQKPFFAYYAPGSAHAPHQAPKDWIAKFKGKFDQGWDKQREETLERQKKLGIVPANTKLTPRPSEIPAWDSLSSDQKRLYAHMMEVYAAALAYCDDQVGRVLNAVDDLGERDNTLVIFVQGDNGASAEGSLQGTTNEISRMLNGVTEDMPYLMSMIDKLGGPETFNHYPVGWAHAMNTPFQWTKQVASHFGGVRNGMVISWPKRIKHKGEVRTQFTHLIDVMPTILEAAGIQLPDEIDGAKQKPIEGTSMVYTFDDAQAKERHTTQYFELVGNRGVYSDGWMASTTPLRLPWITAAGVAPSPDDFKWELYHVAEDFSQANNVASKNREKLKQLQAAFDREAKKYNVYPLDSSFASRADPSIRPSLTRGRTEFTYYPGMVRIPEATAPDIKNKSYSITADVEIPTEGVSGVLVTQAGRFAGWGLLVLDGKPVFVHALSNQAQHKYRVASDQKLSPGKHTITFDFKYDGGGIGKGGTGILSVDGASVAKGRIDRTVGVRFSADETFDIGMDTGTPVIEDYADKMPFKFTGTIEKVSVRLGDDKLTPEAQKEMDENLAGRGMAE